MLTPVSNVTSEVNRGADIGGSLNKPNIGDIIIKESIINALLKSTTSICGNEDNLSIYCSSINAESRGTNSR